MMFPAGHWASPVVHIMTKGVKHVFIPACHGNYCDLRVTQNSIRTFMCVFFLTSLLEYNRFTMLYQFLLYNKEIQPYEYIYPHIPSLLSLPSTLPIPPLQVVTKHRNLPVLCCCFPLAICFTFGSVYMSMLLSHRSSFPSPTPCPQVHSLCLHLYSCPATRFISTIIFRFHIYVLANGICFSLSDLLHSV